MSIQSVLLPVFVELALIFALLGRLIQVRRQAFASGLRREDVAFDGAAYPASARLIAGSYANQFEMPGLFFLAVIFGWALHQTSWLFVIVEWIFVLFRLAHAGVHVTINRLMLRGSLFLGSVVAAVLLWVLIFVGVYFGTVVG